MRATEASQSYKIPTILDCLTVSLFVMLGMDTFKLPTSHGFSELMTMIDYISDLGDTFAVRGSTKEPHVVKAIQIWIPRFDKPLFIVMDNLCISQEGSLRLLQSGNGSD